MAQDSTFIDDPVKPKKDKVYSQPSRSFEHQVSRAAAIIGQQQGTVLTDEQLKQCGYAYINNGIVRGVTDRSVFFIQGERTRAVVEANDEQLEVSSDEEAKQLEQDISDDTLTIGGVELEDGTTTGGKLVEIKELKRKIVRLNKRVKLHGAIEKLLTSALIFGRGFLEIVRIPSVDYPRYGEPVALIHQAEEDIIQCFFNDRTKAFTGIDINTNDPTRPTRFIPASNLIPAFHDDNNILKNTRGSGLSAVWPILSVSQSDDVINDEDIPEITKNTGGVLTVIKCSTNDDNVLRDIQQKANGKTQIVVGADKIDDVLQVPLGRDPHELTDVRTSNGKYICQCMNLPLFLLYEDTANFATANQTMQVYKAGILKRYRTWLQGILEDYWYDLILADHLNIEVKDVISMPIKIKAIFPDINFETKREIIEGDKILVDIGTMDNIDVAKDIDRPDLVTKLESQQADQQSLQQDAVNNTFMNQRNQIAQLQQQNQMVQQMAQVQQASAAASVKEKDNKELEMMDTRIQVLKSIQSVAEKLNADL